MLTLLQFSLRRRLTSLVDEFKLYSRDKIESQVHIDALFATYDQLLLTINLVNDYLQVFNAVEYFQLFYCLLIAGLSRRIYSWLRISLASKLRTFRERSPHKSVERETSFQPKCSRRTANVALLAHNCNAISGYWSWNANSSLCRDSLARHLSAQIDKRRRKQTQIAPLAEISVFYFFLFFSLKQSKRLSASALNLGLGQMRTAQFAHSATKRSRALSFKEQVSTASI